MKILLQARQQCIFAFEIKKLAKFRKLTFNDMNNKLNDNYQFFLDNHDELLSKYANKFLVIKDKKVLYSGDTFEESLAKAQEIGLEIGTFLIQECTDGDSAYTQEFHSRVIFA